MYLDKYLCLQNNVKCYDNFYEVKTTAFILKLKIINKIHKIIYGISPTFKKIKTQFCPKIHTKIIRK